MSGVQLRPRAEILLVVLATGLFTAGLCFVPPTVFESADYVLFLRPMFHFLAEAVRTGVPPLWNPYAGLGRPFLADTQSLVCYPPVYLICAGQGIGVFLLAWLHGLLAIWGMRRLGSGLGIGRWQSYFIGFTYLASGEMTARWMTGQFHFCWGLCYVPWLFYYALRTGEPWQSRRVGQHAMLLALQFLCGHPQVFWFSVIGQAVFIVARALRFRDAARSLGQFGVACVWCAGLVAVLLLPMLELIKHGNRSGTSPEFTNSLRFDWGSFRYLFNPLHAGDVNWESNLFVGTIVVVLGLVGLCRVRERNVRGLLGVLVVGLLIAAGQNTPAFPLFYKWLPGFAGFRIHARAALLVVFALICAAGIWLGRPHPRIQALWERLTGLPIRYAVIGLALLQALDLLQGTWMIKKVYTYAAVMILQAPPARSFERTLADKLRQGGMLTSFQPPPRVCVPPSLAPANYGMIYHYGNFDAGCSLFLRRPWDYLHAVLGVTPPLERGSLSRQVYSRGPFPYPDVCLALGLDPQEGNLVVAVDTAPRASVVYGAEVAAYDTILSRLARGHVIRQCALLEAPLAEPLRQENALPPTPASIRRFEPNSVLVEVDAKERGLLILAEAWYPGWHAQVDGRPSACVPANIWMRAVPVPPGRHQVLLQFHQDYLLAGLLVSLLSAGLLVAVLLRCGRADRSAGFQSALSNQNSTLAACEHPKPTASRRSGKAGRFPVRAATGSAFGRALRASAAGVVVVALVALTEMPRWQGFRAEARSVEAEMQCYLGIYFHAQRQPAQAIAHYTETLRLKPDHVMALCKLAWIRAAYPQAEFRNGAEAVGLAKRACELTGSQAPAPLETLAAAYAEAGQFEDARDIAEKARALALGAGQAELAERPARMLKLFSEHKPYREADRN
jgi:tetratricopeptide (TPR) repeat protein